MKNEKFFCNECRKIFDTPKFYDERHGLDTPPYERVSVCPNCSSDNFFEFETMVEKVEVAEKLLFAIMRFNRHINALKDVFGSQIKNIDLFDGVEMVAEYISEMFYFIDVDMQREILEISSDKDLHKVLMCLKGGL